MPYTSNPLPLEFWTRLEVRLTAAYQVQRARLTEAMAPSLVTVDTGDAALKQAAPARAAIFAQVAELENMQVLLMILAGQARATAFQAEIPDLESHIACLRGMAELYSTALTALPRRLPREQEIQATLTQYNALRNAGTGEITMSERARLRAMAIELPVVGAEDTVEHERGLRALQSNIDQKDAELQNKRVTTMMSLVVPDELASLVESFGVPMARITPPALPAEQAADAQALPAPEA